MTTARLARRTDEVAQRFTAAGHRWTKQRQAVVDVLKEAQTHLDADQVYQLARRVDPRLSLSTVYRTLSVLRDRGVVRELRLGEGHHHYEFGNPSGGSGAKPEHSHLVCRRCGAVVEFSSPLLDRLKRDLQRRYRYHLGSAELEVTGTCQECLLPGRNATAGRPAHV
jgi:Fur family ferric uptake transcriptional regulator